MFNELKAWHFNSDKFTQKKWGHKFTLGSNPHYRTDLLEINKGGYCSWHYHHREYNKFIVLEGTLSIYIRQPSGDIKKLVIGPKHPVTYATVRPGDKHLFYAQTNVQCLEIVYACVSKHDIGRSFEGGMTEDEASLANRLE